MLLRPGSEEQEHLLLFPHIDKVVHFLIFSCLGYCIVMAYPKIRFIIFVYIILIYGVITEILQGEMDWGRSGEVLDIVADLLGGLFGYYFARKFGRFFYINFI